jgi:DNA topoisomerase-1
MQAETLNLDDARLLLSLPRLVGVDSATGDEITAQNGRYGPYLKKGTDSRSLTSEEQIFTVTLEEALAIYAQPKARGRQAAAPPLRELGPDPVTGEAVLVKEGRFGPYVTDGTTNATLRKADSVEEISLERAAELLAEKRAKGPAPRRGGRKPAGDTTTSKTMNGTAAKRTATKTAATKTAATKTAATKTAAAKTAATKTAAAKSTAAKSTTTKTAATKTTAAKTTAAKTTAAKTTAAKSPDAKKRAASKRAAAKTEQ